MVTTVFGNGDVVVEDSLWSGPPIFLECPVSGCRWNSPRSSTLKWFGRGPQESYWDRKAGTRVRTFDGPIGSETSTTPMSALRSPETEPTSGGWHSGRERTAEASWSSPMEVRAKPGSYPYLSMSALPYTQEDLDDGPAQGPEALRRIYQKRDLISVNVDFRQMGVGGITSWGPTALPKYSLPYEHYNYRFILRPLIGADSQHRAIGSDTLPVPRNEDTDERNRQQQEDNGPNVRKAIRPGHRASEIEPSRGWNENGSQRASEVGAAGLGLAALGPVRRAAVRDPKTR